MNIMKCKNLKKKRFSSFPHNKCATDNVRTICSSRFIIEYSMLKRAVAQCIVTKASVIRKHQ